MTQATTIAKKRTGFLHSKHLQATVIYLVINLFIYRRIALGSASLITDSYPPSGPLFIIDPAGGQTEVSQMHLATNAFMHLQMPLVNLFEGLGQSFSAGGGEPWYIPELVFHALFASNYNFWNLLLLVMAQFGAYILARRFNLSHIASLGVGFIYGLSGVIPPNVNATSVLNEAALLPFLIVQLLRTVHSPKRSFILNLSLLSAITALTFTAGWLEVVPLMVAAALLCLIASLFVTPVHFATLARRIGMISVAALVGVLVATPTIIGTLQLLGNTTLIQGYPYALHAPKYWLVTLIDPNAFGRALAGSPETVGNSEYILGNPLVFSLIVGAPFILLWDHLIVQRIRRPKLQDAWPVFLGFVVLFGILSYAGIWGTLHVYSLPPFNRIEILRFGAFLWWLPAALVCGYTIDRLCRSTIPGLLAAAFFAVSGYLVTTVHLAVHSPYNSLLPFSGEQVAAQTFIMLTFLSGLIIAAAATKQRVRQSLMLIALVSALGFYLPRNFFAWPQTGTRLLHELGPSLVAKMQSTSTYTSGPFIYSALMDLRIPTVQLNNVVFDPHYLTLMKAVEPGYAGPSSLAWPPSLSNLTLDRHNAAILRALGVTYLILSGSDTTGSVPDSRIVKHLEIQGISYTLFSFTKASPLVFGPSEIIHSGENVSSLELRHELLDYPRVFSSNPSVSENASSASNIELVKETISTSGFTLKVRARNSGLAVIKFLPMPGESIRVDNGPAESPLRVDQVFSGIRVPKGSSTITASFVTKGDTAGLLISLFAIAVITGGVVVGSRRARKTMLHARNSADIDSMPGESANSRSGSSHNYEQSDEMI